MNAPGYRFRDEVREIPALVARLPCPDPHYFRIVLHKAANRLGAHGPQDCELLDGVVLLAPNFGVTTRLVGMQARFHLALSIGQCLGHEA